MTISRLPESEFNWGKVLRTISLWAILIIGTIAVVQFASNRRRHTLDISYNEFLSELDRRNVVAVRIQGARRLEGGFKTPVQVAGDTSARFVTILPFEPSDVWVSSLIERGVEVRGGDQEQSFGILVLNFLPYLLILGLVLFMLRQIPLRNRQPKQ